YGAAKAAHERAMLSGPIPVQVLRAAQFHEFVAQLVEWGTQGEVSYVRNMRTQLVAARTVAEVLADLATGPGSAGAPFSEVAGPPPTASMKPSGWAIHVDRRDPLAGPDDHELAFSPARVGLPVDGSRRDMEKVTRDRVDNVPTAGSGLHPQVPRHHVDRGLM